MNPATKMKWQVMYCPGMVIKGLVWRDDYSFYVRMFTFNKTLTLEFSLN